MEEQRVFLVRVSYLVPVVAADEDAACAFVKANQDEATSDELEQALEALGPAEEFAPGGHAHLETAFVAVEYELMQEDAPNEYDAWLNVEPWGDDAYIPAKDRLDPEYIYEAAVRHSNGVIFTVPRPGRHHTVIALMNNSDLPFNCQNEGRHEQGFVTNKGRFVDRKEGMIIAKAANQLIANTGGADTLYSEDVW